MDLIINLDSLPNRENQLVYAKPLQIFKGIDNKIKLLIKNQDQKLQSLLDSTIIFNLVDSASMELIFSRRVFVYGGDKRGAAYIMIDQMDLNDIPAGLYNYSIRLINGEGVTSIIYSDDNYNAQGQARVIDGVYPTFQNSLEPNLGPFYNNNPNYNGYSNSGIVYTNVLDVYNKIKGHSGIQTVQFYGTGFNGTVELQGSLSVSLAAYPDDWFTVDTEYFSDFSGCSYKNFAGKIGLIRFKVTTNSGSLDKILYRS